ncbi:MAG: DNA polymerase V [Polynucleobacter sp. 24-46-87]|uniref:DNA recombination protein RmuC n=1 Tax=unclassified Polynucleobacter TaxID=2640945 RepID=UPI000BD4C6B0|nr:MULTISPECIES: DNA recombination protein RmuC [unclassified Polynucleobacter]OYY16696.1 MAG: DNA polymerase V [Polynucleobacter sp. 35-46-11]OZA15189.1 MAG: DNA polymerase V [Polynucleobacter sp. 24-46-87]OZA76832.1 MAG: DNA polymerase V [Polynucleobacter sp. 39-46-10]
MTFDLSSLLLFGLPFGLCAGLLVYALNLRSALTRVEQQMQIDVALAASLRIERDQALQNAIRLEAALDSERKQGLGRIESLNEAKEALTSQFKNLANEILEDKSKRFTEQNVANLDALLKPLQTKLSEFKEQVNTSYGNEARERFALKSEIERLANLNLRMSDETRSLTQALKGDSKVQGNWGELVLESILESSGLRKGEEYLVQDSHTQTDGSRLQPDVVVKLPEGRSLVVDSKVSITAYSRHAQATDPTVSEQELAAHIQSLRQHIQGLSSKNYSSLYGIGSVDFVLMFVPIEPAFLLALKTAPNLYQEALAKNIVLVCPSTLMATLRTVAHLWRQDHQNRNALEIAKQCGTLYDKFVGFVDDLEKLGQRLDQAQTSYHDAFNKLKSGKGNLIRTAEKVRELGVKPSKNISAPLIESSTDT